MPSQSLAAILRHLDATGQSGFEGLIADLLGRLTGRHFHLAQSGTQEGRDLSSRDPNVNVLAVECKRYRLNTALNEREPLGEVVQATIDIPDLDLWVLVASRDVSSQLREILHQATYRQGIEFLVISDADGSPSSLETLCASAPDIVTTRVAKNVPEEVDNVAILLAELANAPGFQERLTYLKAAFLTPLIGYDNWRAEQNQWLVRCFQSAAESRAEFGQILNVAQEDIRLVERHAVWQRLDSWLNTWSDSRRTIAVLGEEGDGKSWSVGAWIQRSIAQKPQFPPVIFLSASAIRADEPDEVLQSAVAKRSPTMGTEQVQQRVNRWLRSKATNTPLFLVVLDGINEHYDPSWWRTLLEKLNRSPYIDTAAIIITCRTGYWSYFSSLRSITAIEYIVPPYDGQELDTALAEHNLSRVDIAPELLHLAKKPRYFDLLIQHREAVAKSGDPTVARLIFEDWRDRLERKTRLRFDHNEFQELLRTLAGRYLAGEESVGKKQFLDLLPFPDRGVFEELRTSGVFLEERGQYRAREQHLVYGLGLLLVEEVETAALAGANIRETIAGWLDPHPGMDIKGQICEAAALRALSIENLLVPAKSELLLAWVTSQNTGPHVETNLSAYFPIDPESYFQLAEALWLADVDHRWGQTAVMNTFLRWIVEAKDATIHLWRARCERWLGFVHRYGFPHQREKTDREGQSVQCSIAERLGFELPLSKFTFAGHQLIAIDDDGLFRLGRAALSLISHVPREPFIHAIATGCVGEAIMDYPSKYEEFAWIVRTSDRPLWRSVQSEAEQLRSSNQRIAQQAAYRLLPYVGTAEAQRLREALPADLFPPHPLAEHHESDPCVSGFSWRRQDCERCVSRTDLEPSWIARQLQAHCIDPTLPVPADIGSRLAPLAKTIDIESMDTVLAQTSADLDFEQYEPALCAYAPEALAAVVYRLVRHITVRRGIALRVISFDLKQHSLIFTSDDHDAIYQAWSTLHQSGSHDENAETAEMFLFAEVMKALDGENQLGHLLARPEENHDLLQYEQHFRPIKTFANVWQQLAGAQSQ